MPLTRRTLLAGGSVLALSNLSAPAAFAAPPAAPYRRPVPHLIEAEQLVDYLRMSDPLATAVNQYKVAGDNRETVLNWGSPGQPGQYRVLAQCGTFLTGTLRRVYGWATPEYFRNYFFAHEPVGTPKWSPTADEFEHAFVRTAAVPHLTKVARPADLVPGDFVAIDYRTPNGSYTGHVVMIRQAKGLFAHSADATLGVPVDPYLFEIVDCTNSAHGDPNDGNLANYEAFPDTRFQPTRDANGNVVHVASGSGAGYGHLVLYAARSTGLFAGYRWSVNSSTAYRATDRPLAGGRFA